jgi:hypothetical protein
MAFSFKAEFWSVVKPAIGRKSNLCGFGSDARLSQLRMNATRPAMMQQLELKPCSRLEGGTRRKSAIARRVD